MPYVTLSLGLTLRIPTNGTRNWGTEVYNNTWVMISQHNHQGGGTGAQLATAALEDQSVTSAKLALNYGIWQTSTVTPAGTTQEIDLAQGNAHKIDLGAASGDVTVSVINPTVGEKKFLIVQGATPRDVIWPATFVWPGGEKPILTGMANDALAKVEAYWDGTRYWATWEIEFA